MLAQGAGQHRRATQVVDRGPKAPAHAQGDEGDREQFDRQCEGAALQDRILGGFLAGSFGLLARILVFVAATFEKRTLGGFVFLLCLRFDFEFVKWGHAFLLGVGIGKGFVKAAGSFIGGFADDADGLNRGVVHELFRVRHGAAKFRLGILLIYGPLALAQSVQIVNGFRQFQPLGIRFFKTARNRSRRRATTLRITS